MVKNALLVKCEWVCLLVSYKQVSCGRPTAFWNKKHMYSSHNYQKIKCGMRKNWGRGVAQKSDFRDFSINLFKRVNGNRALGSSVAQWLLLFRWVVYYVWGSYNDSSAPSRLRKVLLLSYKPPGFKSSQGGSDAGRALLCHVNIAWGKKLLICNCLQCSQYKVYSASTVKDETCTGRLSVGLVGEIRTAVCERIWV